MGTYLNITAKSQTPEQDIQLVYDRIKNIEKEVNRFDKNSDISILNRAKGKKTIVSKDLVACVELAKEVGRFTNGYFDITLSGDSERIIIDKEKSSITLPSSKTKINLDGIAKGYAVREAQSLLFKRGVKDGIINMGSSIAVLSAPKVVGIRDPFKKETLIGTLEIGSNMAISTSGIYEQGLHIIDPKTGKHVDEIEGLTVLGDDAGFMDGLSTGIVAMGFEKGFDFIVSKKIKAIIITKSGKVIRNLL